jgi:hypothetical protein
MRYKDDPDPRIRARFEWEARTLKSAYAALLWAMERQFRKTNAAVSEQIRSLRKQVIREFGMISAVAARAVGPVLLWSARREEKRLEHGQTYEPPTIIERRNWQEA